MENAAFFTLTQKTCFLGNLSLNISGSALLAAPNTLPINESKKIKYCFTKKITTVFYLCH
jgi:hypothetical protein